MLLRREGEEGSKGEDALVRDDGAGSGDLEPSGPVSLRRVRRRSRGIWPVVEGRWWRGLGIEGTSGGICGKNADGVGVRVPAGVPGMLFDGSWVERGTRSSNSDPWLGPVVSDRTQIRSPPILRTRPLATSSPRPRPSFCRVVESSSREKGLKRFGRKS